MSLSLTRFCSSSISRASNRLQRRKPHERVESISLDHLSLYCDHHLYHRALLSIEPLPLQLDLQVERISGEANIEMGEPPISLGDHLCHCRPCGRVTGTDLGLSGSWDLR